MAELNKKLNQINAAYQQLFAGASTLLDMGALHWRERLLLRLVRSLYQQRLIQLGELTSNASE